MLEQVGGRLAALGVTLSWTDDALDVLAKQGFDPSYGARPLRRTIRAGVEDPAAEGLLSGSLKEGDTALICCEDGKLALHFQHALTATKEETV